MKVTVNREHANAGDVLVSLDGGEPFHVPGDVSSFTALRMLGPWLEAELDKRAALVKATSDALTASLIAERNDAQMGRQAAQAQYAEDQAKRGSAQ